MFPISEIRLNLFRCRWHYSLYELEWRLFFLSFDFLRFKMSNRYRDTEFVSLNLVMLSYPFEFWASNQSDSCLMFMYLHLLSDYDCISNPIMTGPPLLCQPLNEFQSTNQLNGRRNPNPQINRDEGHSDWFRHRLFIRSILDYCLCDESQVLPRNVRLVFHMASWLRFVDVSCYIFVDCSPFDLSAISSIKSIAFPAPSSCRKYGVLSRANKGKYAQFV